MRKSLAALLLATAVAGLFMPQAFATPAPAPAAATGELGTVPVALEGSAFLITYYAGVVEGLLREGVIVPGLTPLSGLSGGAFTSVATALGVGGEEQKDLWMDIVAMCTEKWGSCVGHFNTLIGYEMEQWLPENATDVINGLVRIAMSQLDGSQMTLNNSASWVVDNFTSRHDLASALVSTDYIPCFSGSSVYTIFRNQPVIDGGYANGFNDLCPNGDLNNCIKVASWYVGDLADSTCDDRCSSVASRCVTEERPPSEHVTTLYENELYVDQWELNWVQQRCPFSDWVGLPPSPLPAFVPHNSTAIDIHPGKYNPLPVFNGTQLIACQWQDWAMHLPDGMEMEAMETVYELGLADALAWAAATDNGRNRAEAPAPAP